MEQRPYKDLDSATLEKLDAMKERLINQIGIKTLGEMADEYKDSDNIVHNGYYFIQVENPFSNPYKTADTPFKEWIHYIESWGDYLFFKNSAPDDDVYITCIGVADASKKRIWLINTFNNSRPAWLDYKPDAKRPGWYFNNSGRQYYTVYIPARMSNRKSISDMSSLVHPTDELRNYICTYIKPEKLIIKSLTDIKTQLPKYKQLVINREEERKRVKEENERIKKKQAEEAKAAKEREEAELRRRIEQKEKAYQEFFKDYTYIGQQAPFSTFPYPEYRELYNKANKDPDAEWLTYEDQTYSLGNHRGRSSSGTMYNPKYKLYMRYAYDTTD